MRQITFDILATDLSWTWRRNVLPGHKAFFLSFTDAVRYLVSSRGMDKDTIILLPELYCPHTAHALMTMATVRFYKVHHDLTIDEEDLKKQTERTRPAMVILYSYFGGSITSDVYTFLKREAPDAIVVDDYAHRNLEGSAVNWKHPHHIYIDSIRKHTPYLGSHMIGNFDFGKPQGSISGYSLFCHLIRACENAANAVARVTGSAWARDLGERLFESLDSRIGDGQESAPGGKMAEAQWPFINIRRVKKQKELLKSRFARILKPANADNIERFELCYLPVMAAGREQEQLLSALSEGGIAAEQMWDYERWMPERAKELFDSLVILPLTGAMKEKDIDSMCALIKESTQ